MQARGSKQTPLRQTLGRVAPGIKSWDPERSAASRKQRRVREPLGRVRKLPGRVQELPGRVREPPGPVQELPDRVRELSGRVQPGIKGGIPSEEPPTELVTIINLGSKPDKPGDTQDCWP